MKLLLVGIDFSSRSDRALRRAVILARKLSAEILLINVTGEGAVLEEGGRQESHPSATLRRLARTLHEDEGLRCHIEVRNGRPAEQLAKAAQDANADLLVIGPHRRRLIRDSFGAITAERIVQQVQIPVIAANTPPSGHYRRVLVPIDLDHAFKDAAHTFQTLNLADNAEIVLMHVYDPEAREMLSRAMVRQDLKRKYLAERARSADNELKAFADKFGLGRATRRVLEARGSDSSNIEEFALEDATDLIILPRSQKGVVARSILGSVTSDLIRSARIDVLIAPSGNSDL